MKGSSMMVLLLLCDILFWEIVFIWLGSCQRDRRWKNESHRIIFLSKLWVHNSLTFLPWGFSQIPIFHSVDMLQSSLSSPRFRDHFCICSVKLAITKGNIEDSKKEKRKKKDQVCHIRLCFLPIKWIDLRLHKHVGQYQVSEKKQANCKIRNKPHLKIRYCCNGKNTKLSILQTLYSSLIPSFIVVFKSFKKVSSCFCPLAFCHMHFAATLVYYAHNPRMRNRWFYGKCFLVQLLSQNTYETSYAQ